MKIQFYKYQGAGNDFIMIDDRKMNFPQSQELIAQLCDRHFGVGADGLILLQNDADADFKMVYFNSDGNESTMCGNGGRCIVRFAESLNLIQEKATFNAVDGLHEAFIFPTHVELKMVNVSEVQHFPSHYFLHTGSPHHVEFVMDVSEVKVAQKGAEIRYGSPYFEEGANVNFVEILGENSLRVRTYERGVEDETLACGTGVTAAAIAAFDSGKLKTNEIQIQALGGNLAVKFDKNASGGYENVWLSGPAEFVFTGEVNI